MTSPRRIRGFTLIELLIAIAIFVVMAAMAYGGLSSMIDTREAMDSALERSKTLQMAVWRMRNDIEQIVNRPIRDRFGDVEPPLVGSAETGIRFTRNGWRNPLNETRSNLQRVAYRLDGDNNLVRSYWRVLDRAQDSTPIDSTLLENVETIEWRYLDRDRRWQERWPGNADIGIGGRVPATATATATGAGAGAARQYAPPRAIELRVSTAAWGELRLLFMVPGADR